MSQDGARTPAGQQPNHDQLTLKRPCALAGVRWPAARDRDHERPQALHGGGGRRVCRAIRGPRRVGKQVYGQSSHSMPTNRIRPAEATERPRHSALSPAQNPFASSAMTELPCVTWIGMSVLRSPNSAGRSNSPPASMSWVGILQSLSRGALRSGTDQRACPDRRARMARQRVQRQGVHAAGEQTAGGHRGQWHPRRRRSDAGPPRPRQPQSSSPPSRSSWQTKKNLFRTSQR